VSNLIGAGKTITPVAGKPLYGVAAYRWGGLDKDGNPQGFLNGVPSTDYNAIEQAAIDSGLKSGSFDYIGPASPDYFGGLMNTVSWKGFALSVNITFKLHYYLFRPSLSYYSLANYGTSGMDYNKRWQQAGDEMHTDVPSFAYPLDNERDLLYDYASINVIRGDHIRLQFINLSYSFERIGRLPFKGLQLYANAANLGIIWRANKYGLDPDYLGAIPPPKNYTFGLRTNF
jgi:hypothetical protein